MYYVAEIYYFTLTPTLQTTHVTKQTHNQIFKKIKNSCQTSRQKTESFNTWDLWVTTQIIDLPFKRKTATFLYYSNFYLLF